MNLHYCKLTSTDMTTYGGFQWELNKTVSTSGRGQLCSDGWLHFYLHPLLAVFLNSLHSDFESYRLFEVEVEGPIKHDKGLKAGAMTMRLTRELELPSVTLKQRVHFAENCVEYAKSRVGRPSQTPEEIADALVQCALSATA